VKSAYGLLLGLPSMTGEQMPSLGRQKRSAPLQLSVARAALGAFCRPVTTLPLGPGGAGRDGSPGAARVDRNDVPEQIVARFLAGQTHAPVWLSRLLRGAPRDVDCNLSRLLQVNPSPPCMERTGQFLARSGDARARYG
jgi:hypothetical protein